MTTLRAAMPEAAIDENGNLLPGKEHIWFTR